MACCGNFLIYDSHTGDNICPTCGKSEVCLNDNEQYPVAKPSVENEFIGDVCANNHLPSCIELEATVLFSKGSSKNKKQLAFAACCIYQACKQQNVGRSLIEVSRMCFIPPGEISAFLLDERELRPEELVERICWKLGIADYSRKKQISLLSENIYTYHLRCSPPQSSIAVAISEIMQETPLSQTDIARACDISPSCLRRLNKTYKKAPEEKKLAFDKKIPKKKDLF